MARTVTADYRFRIRRGLLGLGVGVARRRFACTGLREAVDVVGRVRRSRQLGQGCSAQTCRVEIEPWRESLPPITAFDPPGFIRG